MSALGTEFKYGVRMPPIGDIHLEMCDFEVETYVYTNKSVKFSKGDTKHIHKIDKDSYMVIVDKESALKIGRGVILAKLIVHIPDNDFEDGFRTEVYDKLQTSWIIT